MDDDDVHCLDSPRGKQSNRDENINISDVIEVIETDRDFNEGKSKPRIGGGATTMSYPSTSGMSSSTHNGTTGTARPRKPTVKIVEQPAGKALRFRYECEGRSAGSIPGASSTPENKTFPTILIEGYKGRAVVVVSCVTKDPPYRPHPHNLVGREGCKKGVCTLEVSPDTMTVQFSNLGIQCVKKKDIESALRVREDIRVDPFRTGYDHRSQPTSIDLNAVRLAFQVFLQSHGENSRGFTQPLTPVVSDPIFDKKAMTDLSILKLSHSSSLVDGGNSDIILLCEKVAKEDIQVRFYEELNGAIIWEGLGEFQPSQVHKQTAIWFRPPRYHRLDVTESLKMNIQLRRPSDGATSVPLPFEMKPLDSAPGMLKRKRQKFESDPNCSILRNRNMLLQDIKSEPRDTSPAPYIMPSSGMSPNYAPNPHLSPLLHNYRNPNIDTLGPTPPPADLATVYPDQQQQAAALPSLTNWNYTATPQDTNQMGGVVGQLLPNPSPAVIVDPSTNQPHDIILDMDNQNYMVHSLNSGDFAAMGLDNMSGNNLSAVMLNDFDRPLEPDNMTDSLTRLTIATINNICNNANNQYNVDPAQK